MSRLLKKIWNIITNFFPEDNGCGELLNRLQGEEKTNVKSTRNSKLT